MDVHRLSQHWRNEQHALVVGGGLAGLLAARVLLDHFGRVTWAETATTLAVDGPLLHPAAGQRLERLFPGLAAELTLAGAHRLDWTADCELLLPGGPAPRFVSDLVVWLASPGLLHSTLRARLLTYGGDRLSICHGMAWDGLLGAAGQRRVTGLHLAGDSTPDELRADLVVLAGGAGAALPAWLARLGLDLPPVMHITTAWQVAGWPVRPAATDTAWTALASAGTGSGGFICPLEDGRWWAVLIGPQGTRPAMVLDRLRSGRGRLLATTLDHAEPLGLMHCGPLALHLRRCDRAWRWPENLLLLGADALQLPPALGAGAAAAALSAAALAEALEEGTNGLATRFHRRLAGRLRRLLLADSMPWGAAWLRSANHDPAVLGALLEVMGGVASPVKLARPDLMVRLLRHTLTAHPAPAVRKPLA